LTDNALRPLKTQNQHNRHRLFAQAEQNVLYVQTSMASIAI